ncbi:hypothetical protein CFter6_3046 [Collimonas fungivorans]|uniref:Uncharacterized protein n=1 Tax=Collimonas fungivorans TaxID=158899 RepID=A0A127PD19_9BURK|nr:hypothetical protein CFter6_3046 [Collimonas fungivorans]
MLETQETLFAGARAKPRLAQDGGTGPEEWCLKQRNSSKEE